MEEVLEATSKHPDIREVYLHVWAANDGALRFYERLGFQRGEEVPNYYRGITPNAGLVLRKAINEGTGGGPGGGAPPLAS